MKLKTIIPIAIVALVIGLIAYKLTVNKKALDAAKTQSATKKVDIAVTAVTVSQQPVASALNKTGTLLPFKEANIMATSAGKITELNLELGNHVTEGQKLGLIDNRLKQLALEKAELNLAKLKTDVDRYTALLAGNATTETSVNDVKFNYEDTNNQVEQLKKQLADATIVAPVSGTITMKKVEKGEYVNNGTPIGYVVDISKLKVQVMLSESEINLVKLNQSVKVTTSSNSDKGLTASITYISPKGDDAHNYLVELTANNNQQNPLKAGGIVYVDFSRSTSETAMQIPRSSLVESVKNPYVYVFENGKAVQRKIKVGRELGDNIEVLDGLKTGEVVITSGQINLSDSVAVQVITTNK